MKNLIILIIALLNVTLCDAQGKNERPKDVPIGTIIIDGKPMEIQAVMYSDSTIAYYVFPNNWQYTPAIPAGSAKIVVTNTPDLIENAYKILAKYKEWKEQLIANNIKEIWKKIEIEWPFKAIILNWGKGKRQNTCFFENLKYFSFDYKESSSAFKNGPRLQAYSGVNTRSGWHEGMTGMYFTSPEEFEAFIEFIKPENIKKRLREGVKPLFQ